MTTHSRLLLGVFGLGIALAAPTAAQSSSGSPIELGMDARLATRWNSFGGETGNRTTLAFPVNQVRVGFALNEMIEVEPALGFGYSTLAGGHSTSADLIVGLPINLQTDRSKPNWYVRPLVGLDRESTTIRDENESSNQVSFGAGVGVRVPIDRRFAGRFEANYMHGNHTDAFGSYDQLGLLAGLSFFTR
jgi:hypothetical protein